MNQVFADTYFFLALANRLDAGHVAATQIGRLANQHWLTTAWVLTELADALSSPRERHFASRLIRELRGRARVYVVPPSEEWFDRGMELFETRPDKVVDAHGLHFLRRHATVRRTRGSDSRPSL